MVRRNDDGEFYSVCNRWSQGIMIIWKWWRNIFILSVCSKKSAECSKNHWARSRVGKDNGVSWETLLASSMCGHVIFCPSTSLWTPSYAVKLFTTTFLHTHQIQTTFKLFFDVVTGVIFLQDWWNDLCVLHHHLTSVKQKPNFLLILATVQSVVDYTVLFISILHHLLFT